MTTETGSELIEINVSGKIMEFVKEMIEKKRFADVSNAFELMAHEFMEREQTVAEPMEKKLEKLVQEGMKMSSNFVKDSMELVQNLNLAEKMKKSVDTVKESEVLQSMKEKTDSVSKATKETVKDSLEKIKGAVSPEESSKKDGPRKIKIEDN